MSMMGPTHPADVGQGFPNPLAEHYEGERTPEEQFLFEQEQARREAAGLSAQRGQDAANAQTPTGLPQGQATAEDRAPQTATP